MQLKQEYVGMLAGFPSPDLDYSTSGRIIGIQGEYYVVEVGNRFYGGFRNFRIDSMYMYLLQEGVQRRYPY